MSLDSPPSLLRIRFSLNKELVYAVDTAGPIELGRQVSDNDPVRRPFRSFNRSGQSIQRVCVVDKSVTGVPRELVRLHIDGQAIRVTNISQYPIKLEPGGLLHPKEPNARGDPSVLVPSPTVISLGNAAVRVEARAAQADDESPDSGSYHSLDQPTLAPGMARADRTDHLLLLSQHLPKSEDEQARWLLEVATVIQRTTVSEDFFQAAATAMRDLIGLDLGAVLLRRDGRWQVDQPAAQALSSDVEVGWSRRMLDKLCREKRTFYQSFKPGDHSQSGSLSGVSAIVASPILDRQGEVIGGLYGARRDAGTIYSGRTVTKLEAALVEVLAQTVAAGLARLEQERAALAERTRFEQFFTVELAEQLARDPTLLEGRDAEVTILFCDIRGFSRVSERHGPAKTMAWIGDVMGALSDCILDEGGVLVDYVGDEVMAMWGAPRYDARHAERACRAARAMYRALDQVNVRWQAELGEPTCVGIGINTGHASVGNSGSRHKFKYGPLGNTVNLASRVQGATKYLRVPILLTDATRKQLGDELPLRRLCSVRVVNIEQPVTLYELAAGYDTAWRALRSGYESALARFEKRDMLHAIEELSNILKANADDGPSTLLLSRAVDAHMRRLEPFDPAWELPGK